MDMYVLQLLNPSYESDVTPVTVFGTLEMHNAKEQAFAFPLRLFEGS